MTKIKNSNRLSKYELLRFLCALMVVFFHIQVSDFLSPEPFTLSGLYISLKVFAILPVATFLFLTGFFLVNYQKNRLIYIFAMIIIYYIINLMVGSLIIYLTNVNEEYNFVALLIGGPYGGYIGAVPFVYLFAPLINIALKKINRGYSLNCLIVLYFLAFGYSFLDHAVFFNPGPTQLIFLISIYSGGAGGKLYAENFGLKKGVLKLTIVIFILIQITNIVLFHFKLLLNDKSTSSPFAVLGAIGIFIIFQNLRIKQNRFYDFLGKLTLPIYLFHYLFEIIFIKAIVPKLGISMNTSPDLYLFIGFMITSILTIIFSTIILYPSLYLIKKTNQYLDNLFSKITNKKFWNIDNLNDS